MLAQASFRVSKIDFAKIWELIQKECLVGGWGAVTLSRTKVREALAGLLKELLNLLAYITG